MRVAAIRITAFAILVFALAGSYQSIVVARFRPTKVLVDLSHRDQTPALEGPWDLRPDARFLGIMKALDRGQPVMVRLPLPAGESYWCRLKFKFLANDQVIDVLVNDTPITTVQSAQAGTVVKVNVTIPATVITEGVTRVRFVNRGSPGGTEYELVRCQNYRGVVVKNGAYLVLRQGTPLLAVTSPQRLRALGWLILALVAVATGGTWLVRWVTRRSWREAVVLEGALWTPLWLLLILPLVAVVTPYRVVCTPSLFWRLSGGWLAISHLVVFATLCCVALGRRMMAWRLQMPTRHPARHRVIRTHGQWKAPLAEAASQLLRRRTSLAEAVSQSLRWIWYWGKLGIRVGAQVVWQWSSRGSHALWRWGKLGIRVGAQVVWQWSSRGSHALWRWFLRHQSPRGYGRLFCYGIAIALLSHWVFRWELFAEVMGYLGGIALVIAVVWESLISFREEE